jgi:asparagine synthase (glutamine-hydrolysing)
MGAIYGILGVSNKSELENIGTRLNHRGEISISCSVSRDLHLGSKIVGQFNNNISPPDVPVVFDGLIDIPVDIISFLKFEDQVDETAKLIFELYCKMGPSGFRYIRAPFAIALWDEQSESLILATDPLGIKMLYYTSDSYGRIIFASEYKALFALDSFSAAPDRDAIQYAYRTKYAMPGRSCLAGVKSLVKGSWLQINKSKMCSKRYLDVKVNISEQSEKEHAQALKNNLIRATEQIAYRFDKIGVALSGGVDSVAVLAAARKNVPEKEIHSFTVGINASDNILIEAKRVAEYFKTTHHELIIKANDLPELIKNTLWHMEEPTGREERILYYSAAIEAAKHVPIILTGHNSDTIYGGMPRHLIANIAYRLPIFRKPISDFYNYTQMGAVPQTIFGKILVTIYFKGVVIPECNVIGANWNQPKLDLQRLTSQPLNEYLRKGEFYGAGNAYATEKIFNGTCVSIISPFWDIDLIQSAFQIPDWLKIKGLKQKLILNRALVGLLPEHLMNRKKDYLRIINDIEFSDCLEYLANNILSYDVVKERGLFEYDCISKLKSRRKNGFYTMEEFYNLWSLILIEMWCRIYIDNRGDVDITV